jgi:hypothetical protein
MTARQRRTLSISGLLVAAAFGIARPALAEEPPKADSAETRERFRRGVEFYDEGDYKLALIEFERAYQLSPSYKILYNIGQVHSQLGHYAKAVEWLNRYLQEGGERIPADRQAEVKRELDTLHSRTALLAVGGTEGTEIVMDDEPLGKIPVASVRVNAGNHRLTAKKPGFLPQDRTLVLAGGDVENISFVLRPEPVATTKRAPETRTAAWVTWAGAGALGAGALVTGLVAMGSASDLKTLRETAGSSGAERESASDRARNFSIASDILLGSALVAGGVALYLTLKKPSEPSTTTAIRDVRLTWGLNAVGAAGSF